MLPLYFITFEERELLNENTMKAGGYRDQFDPGTLFYASWLHDPSCAEDIQRLRHYTGQWRYLSDFYWKTWADRRAPLLCVLPNGRLWCLDSRATNGPGWTIKFDDGKLPGVENRRPLITATPSIQTDSYHGWLKAGSLIPC